MASICEGCAFERYLDTEGKRVCISKTAFRQGLTPKRIPEGEDCDNREVYKPLTPAEMADAANYPLG